MIALTVAGLAGCSSMTELKTETLSKKTVPTWYLDHVDTGSEKSAWYKPWDQQGMYYAVAEDVSPSMEFAMKKQRLKPRLKLQIVLTVK